MEKLEYYWDDIPTDASKAISYTDLKYMWNASERKVRLILNELSRFDSGDNFVLIRSGSSKGFYKTDDLEIIERYKRECLKKGRSVFAPVKKINRVIASISGNQYAFDNNLKLSREQHGLSQKEVCDRMRSVDEAFDIQLLSKMENGFCMPTPAQLAKLAEIYESDPSELVWTEWFMN